MSQSVIGTSGLHTSSVAVRLTMLLMRFPGVLALVLGPSLTLGATAAELLPSAELANALQVPEGEHARSDAGPETIRAVERLGPLAGQQRRP
jgi:hypothetical protein